jgi:hypothetical protein
MKKLSELGSLHEMFIWVPWTWVAAEAALTVVMGLWAYRLTKRWLCGSLRTPGTP